MMMADTLAITSARLRRNHRQNLVALPKTGTFMTTHPAHTGTC